MQSKHAHSSHEHHDHDHEHSTVQEWLKTAILLGLGFYLTYIILSGNLANYINNRFAWLSVVAATLFFMLGAVSAYGLIWPHRVEAHADHHDHDHGHLSWPILAIVAVPLILGTLIPSKPLGADAIGENFQPDAGAGIATMGDQVTITSDPLDWNVLDWMRAFNRSDDLTTFNGQEADMIGFIFQSDQFPENHFMVSRFVISCCVADASPIGLPVQVEDADNFEADTWVRVRGAFEIGCFGSSDVPILYATEVEEIDTPEHPYLYP